MRHTICTIIRYLLAPWQARFFILNLCLPDIFDQLKADRPHPCDYPHTPTDYRQTPWTGNDSSLLQTCSYCSLLHSAKLSFQYRLLRARAHSDKWTDGWTLPSTLSPCFDKATWSITNSKFHHMITQILLSC